jgi:uncharacterized coiled-coil protein SlyX
MQILPKITAYRFRKSEKFLRMTRMPFALQMALIELRHQFNTQANYVAALEQVVRQRWSKIDALNETIDRLRLKNQQVGLENTCLVALLVAPGDWTGHTDVTAREEAA